MREGRSLADVRPDVARVMGDDEEKRKVQVQAARAAWIAAGRRVWEVSAQRAELSEAEDRGEHVRAKDWENADDSAMSAAEDERLAVDAYLNLLGLAPTVKVKVENDYECGRHSEAVETAPMPWAETIDDDWWMENLQTGDGHPCGAKENAIYEFTIIECADRPELVGVRYEAG